MKSNRKSSSWLALCLLVVFAIGPLATWSQAQQAERSNGGTAMASPATSVKPTAATQGQSDPFYQIGTGDVLGVNVWREPEMTQKLVVRPDGMISLPLIGDLPARGRTPEKLAGEVTDKLKSYITDPRVTVIVVEVHSKWYVITGEVNKPGQYPLTRSLTILEALSSASGFREFAKTKKIYVLHSEGGKTVRLPFHYNNVVKGKNLNENVEVHDGDTIVVP